MTRTILLATAAAAFPFTPAAAQTSPAPADQTTSETSKRTDVQQASPKPAPAKGGEIVITGRRLDVARDAITPSLGASQYTFDKEALNKQPGGTNLTLN